MRQPCAAPALLAAAIVAAGPAAGAEPTVEETRAELLEVCERLREGENPYLGRGVLASIEAGLERPLVPFDRIRLQGRLAAEQIRLGRHEEALRQLDRMESEHADLLAKEPWLRGRLAYTRALAWFQLGEDRNCVEHHAARSCIVPFAAEAVHHRPEAVRAAADELETVLSIDPDDLRARWLLNLSRLLSDGNVRRVPRAFRLPEDAFRDASGFPSWRDEAGELGISPFDLSGGSLMDDFDGDGDLDLVTSTWDPCGTMRAFRNDGNDRFVDVTEAWGLHGQLGGLNLVHADYDGDGALDVLVLRGAWLGEQGRIRNSLLRNRLHEDPGRFVDVTAAAGLAWPAYPTQTAAWADVEGDGDLDLFVGNESPSSSGDPQSLLRIEGPSAYPSQLFLNRGDGTFVDRAREAGLARPGFVKGVAWGDVDGDRDPDLFLSTFGRNLLFRNDRGRFTEVGREAGIGEDERPSFATWFFDFDDDGDLDLFVADYGASLEAVLHSYLEPSADPAPRGHPLLYRNRGDGTFEDVSEASGFVRPLLPMGAGYGDLDGDGRLDLYLGTGLPDFAALVPNAMYRNVDGTRFEEVTFSGGFGQLQKGHSVAFGDLDGDGDEDLYQQLGGAYPYDAFGNAFLRNPTEAPGWIVVRLDGGSRIPLGHGARVRVRIGDPGAGRTIHRTVGTGGSSFGGPSVQAEVGLGSWTGPVDIEIDWGPLGGRQRIRSASNNRYHRVVRTVADDE